MMNITPFSPAERKALMEELFPLKRTARDYDLRQDMTLDGYIASVIVQRAVPQAGRPCTKRYYPGGGGTVPRLERCREGNQRGGMTDADLRTGREAL